MKQFSYSSLMAARGNSGVIISQFIRGLAAGAEGLQTFSLKGFAAAFAKGSKQARQAVSKPVEGTMLTVFTVPLTAIILGL